MMDPFEQSFLGEPGAVDAACAWVGAIVRSVQPEQADLAMRITRELTSSAVHHAAASSERLHLRIIPFATNLVIEVRDPGAPASDGTTRSSWAELSRDVTEFGTKKIGGQGRIAWVLLPARRASHG
jgi:hypothetical protein